MYNFESNFVIMGYLLPISWDTKVDPSVLEWEKDLPEDIKRNHGLRDFLVRMAPRIYDNIGGANYDPFYKIKEILNQDKRMSFKKTNAFF